MTLSRILFLFLIISVSSCAIFTERLSKAYPMKTQPDYSCTIGNGESGILYYLWECYEGERTIIYNRASGLYWSSNHREVGKCGNKTKHELETGIDIKNKTQCHEVFPYPYEATSTKPHLAKLVREDQLIGCDFIGFFESYKDSKKEAIQDIRLQLTAGQAHAFIEPEFEKGIINKDKWISKGFVCYSWNEKPDP